MDRNMLIELLQDGMHYPPGKHRFWVSRCFEITVRPDKVVELDEYEDFKTENGRTQKHPHPPKQGSQGMFHVGKSVLYLKGGRLVESTGGGWQNGA